eukprot:scaffold735_cov255-Pinguiococcus_pyrenoidosus.AAC.11
MPKQRGKDAAAMSTAGIQSRALGDLMPDGAPRVATEPHSRKVAPKKKARQIDSREHDLQQKLLQNSTVPNHHRPLDRSTYTSGGRFGARSRWISRDPPPEASPASHILLFKVEQQGCP